MVVAGIGLAVVDRLLGHTAPPPVVLARRLQPVGALAAAVSLALDPGGVAGALALCWLAVCVSAGAGGTLLLARVLAARAARRRDGSSSLSTVALAAGLCYLTVGGLWLVIGRFDLHPLDLSTDMVRLTAVHFHYAGFALPLLAASGLVAVDYFASRVSLVLGCVGAVVGPPVVAAGIGGDQAAVQVLGAVVMTVAAWSVAFGTFLLATSTSALATRWPSTAHGPASTLGRTFLVVSAASSFVPMVLALVWSLGQLFDFSAMSVDAMASTHGVLNGIGFVVAGLTGWYLVMPRHAARDEPPHEGRALASTE